MKPILFSMIMYPTVSLSNELTLGDLLDVFESNEKFSPTHWGNSERVRVEYNRNEIIEKATIGNIAEIYLHRDKTVKYTGSFDVNWSPRSFLKIIINKSMPQKQWRDFFELSDRIAEIMKPRFGVTHIFWPLSYPWNTEHERLQMWMDKCSYPVPVKFLPNGPLGLGTRTYFGGHILDMFGKDFLLSSPGIVTELKWDGLRLDVVENPEEGEFDAILDAWANVMKYLESAKVLALPDFDEDKMGMSFSPNIVWKEYLGR